MPFCKGSTQRRTKEIEAAGRSESASKHAFTYTCCDDLHAETALVGCAMEACPFAPALVTLEHQLVCICHFRKRHTTAHVLDSIFHLLKRIADAVTFFICAESTLMRFPPRRAVGTEGCRHVSGAPEEAAGQSALAGRCNDLNDDVRALEATGPRSSTAANRQHTTAANRQHTTARSLPTLLSPRPRPPPSKAILSIVF